jgi:hypothetical protein
MRARSTETDSFVHRANRIRPRFRTRLLALRMGVGRGEGVVRRLPGGALSARRMRGSLIARSPLGLLVTRNVFLLLLTTMSCCCC